MLSATTAVLLSADRTLRRLRTLCLAGRTLFGRSAQRETKTSNNQRQTLRAPLWPSQTTDENQMTACAAGGRSTGQWRVVVGFRAPGRAGGREGVEREG